MTLPDVNVWLAGVWARHVDHKRAKAWLDDGDEEYGFCRVTEMALLRLLTKRSTAGATRGTRRFA